MLFKWKDIYSCNIEEIDNQHKRLFQLGSEMYRVACDDQEQDKYDKIMMILNELKDYTIYHFNYEEALMERANYPELDKHKIEHQRFIDKIQEMVAEDVDNKQQKAAMDLMIFIADWIEKHILKSDAGYKGFIK